MNQVLPDCICIKVPPSESMVRVLRLATSDLANRVGLNLDQADDISTALEEVFHAVLSIGGNQDADFNLCYRLYSDRLEITAEKIALNPSDEASRMSRYSRFLIERIVDDFNDYPNPEGGYDVLMVKYLARG